ncbi:MAG: hypothetical protein ACKVXR_09980 [Planctomycetota bacterium]
MDTLALLCNLLAEGPATLRVLHREGVKTLSDVDAQRIEHLADLLGSSPAGARRFAGEARMLAARMGTDPLEREQNAPFVSADVPEEAPRSSPIHGQGIEPTRTAPKHYTPSVPGTTLRPGSLEGLDAALCDRLARERIHTLDALAEASGSSLAKRLGIGLPRLMDLEYLARCRLAESPTSSAPTEDAHPAPARHEPGFGRPARHSARQELPPRRPLIAGWIEHEPDVSGPFV